GVGDLIGLVIVLLLGRHRLVAVVDVAILISDVVAIGIRHRCARETIPRGGRAPRGHTPGARIQRPARVKGTTRIENTARVQGISWIGEPDARRSQTDSRTRAQSRSADANARRDTDSRCAHAYTWSDSHAWRTDADFRAGG